MAYKQDGFTSNHPMRRSRERSWLVKNGRRYIPSLKVALEKKWLKRDAILFMHHISSLDFAKFCTENLSYLEYPSGYFSTYLFPGVLPFELLRAYIDLYSTRLQIFTSIIFSSYILSLSAHAPFFAPWQITPLSSVYPLFIQFPAVGWPGTTKGNRPAA